MDEVVSTAILNIGAMILNDQLVGSIPAFWGIWSMSCACAFLEEDERESNHYGAAL